MDPAIRYRQKRLTPSGDKRFYWRHVRFAERAVAGCVKHGMRFGPFSLPPIVEAYLLTYPKAASRAGARASMSRLMRRRDVRAAIQWFYAIQNREIPWQPIPETPSGVREVLASAGNWRARAIPPCGWWA